MNRVILITAGIIILFTGIWFVIGRQATPAPQVATTAPSPSSTPNTTPTTSTASSSTPKPTPTATKTPTPTPTPTATPQPTKLTLTVPFIVQAPTANWDALHEDACEETSLLMLKHYLDHTPAPSKADADAEIIAMVHWEEAHGYGGSITLEQLNQVAKDYLGISSGQVKTLTSTQALKTEIQASHPTILGMAGKILPNPHFKNGGPNYHMLVTIGYDSTGIITNDPGTQYGQNFHYTTDAFYNAIHNWTEPDILQGAKEYLVFL